MMPLTSWKWAGGRSPKRIHLSHEDPSIRSQKEASPFVWGSVGVWALCFLLFPGLPLHSLARQPVSAKTTPPCCLACVKGHFADSGLREVLLTKFNTYCPSPSISWVACLHTETQTEFMLWHFKLRNFYEILLLRLSSASLRISE